MYRVRYLSYLPLTPYPSLFLQTKGRLLILGNKSSQIPSLVQSPHHLPHLLSHRFCIIGSQPVTIHQSSSLFDKEPWPFQRPCPLFNSKWHYQTGYPGLFNIHSSFRHYTELLGLGTQNVLQSHTVTIYLYPHKELTFIYGFKIFVVNLIEDTKFLFSWMWNYFPIQTFGILSYLDFFPVSAALSSHSQSQSQLN